MPRRRREGTTRGQRGASLVEFALIVPLLSMFLFGIVQFGLAYDLKQSINSAAREGARMAAIPDDATVDYDAIVERVNSSFDSISTGTVDSVTVEIVDAGTNTVVRTVTAADTESPCKDYPGETVRVTAVKEHEITIPFFGTMNPDLTGTGEFRCEIDQ